MKTREYKAIKNFFHNSMLCGRQEIKEILKEVTEEIVRDEVKQFLHTNKFADQVARFLRQYKYSNFEEQGRFSVAKVIEQEVREQLKKRFDFLVEKKQ